MCPSGRAKARVMPAVSEELITIGKIVNTHGIKGAVRVVPLTDFPERFSGMERVRVATPAGQRELDIEHVSPHKKYVIVKFREVTDFTAAQALKGCLLQVTRDELAALPEGSYYIFDIVGLLVQTSSGDLLGKVTEVLQTGANDVYVVETGAKPLLLPATKEVVKEIDLDARRMVVELPEGL